MITLFTRQLHRSMAAATFALLSACGGGSGGGSEPAQPAPSPATSTIVQPTTGKVLGQGWSTYPRLIRLEHQADTSANGTLLASVTETATGSWQPGFYASTDEGTSFRRTGGIEGVSFTQGGCCGTVYELPQRVGAMAAGTILYAVSTGYDVAGTRMRNEIFASVDAGRTFAALPGGACGASTVPTAPGATGFGIWEPEFFVAADGSLNCLFSDETVQGHGQVIRATRSTDGVTWSEPITVLSGGRASDRIGMATVRRLPSGRYLMAFETCSTERLDCAVHLKSSPDGQSWGDPSDLGTRPQSADGHFLRHTPTFTVMPGPSRTVVLAGQLIARPDGTTDPDLTGRAVFVTASNDLAGPWTIVAAPVGLPSSPSASNWCQNYSSALLADRTGTRLTMIQTDAIEGGGCAARFGTSVLGSAL